MAWNKLANNILGTLDAAIAAGATAMDVTLNEDSQDYPAGIDADNAMYLTIRSPGNKLACEIVKVTAVTGANVTTMLRGQRGTDAAGWAAGSVVSLNLHAQDIDEMRTVVGADGNLTGNVTGDVTGNVTGDLTGNVTGNLTGDVTGNLTGDVTGNVTGDVTGNVTGDLTGNVTGDVTGDITTEIIKPPADTTTAIKVTKADGTTAIVTVDSTNERVGIGVAPDAPLHVSGEARITGVAKVGGTIESGMDTSATPADLAVKTGAAKTLVLETPVYNDINFSVDRGNIPGVNFPNWSTFRGATYMKSYQFGVDEYIELGSIEILHDYKEGTALVPHVHIVLSAATLQEEKARWRLYYSIGNASGTMSEENSVEGEVTIADATAQYTHVLITMSAIPSTGIEIGAALKATLIRTAKSAGGNELTAEPWAINVGVHYQIDTLGSRTVLAK